MLRDAKALSLVFVIVAMAVARTATVSRNQAQKKDNWNEQKVVVAQTRERR